MEEPFHFVSVEKGAMQTIEWFAWSYLLGIVLCPSEIGAHLLPVT